MIDKIIDQFGETTRRVKTCIFNKRTLASLSMVARAWRKRSQKHLFSVIDFQMLSPMDVTEADLNELGPVFSLTKDLNIVGSHKALSLFDPATAAFLRYFRNLESLSLTHWCLGRLSARQLSAYLGHFGKTLTHLELMGEASSESLIYLTSMLTRLRFLEILIIMDCDKEPRGLISREELPTVGSFQGYICLSRLTKNTTTSSSSSHPLARSSIRSAPIVATSVTDWKSYLVRPPSPSSR